MKIIHDNDVYTSGVNTTIQLSHLTFNDDLDELQLLATNEQAELEISYTAYGEME